MSSRLRNILLGVVCVLLLAGVVVAAIFYAMPRRSFPDMDGEIRVPGLTAPVDIYRDAYGVPHIYAETTHDLFFAQGYIHAQDRFWQMDFWRHIGSGRLSEMFGESQLETDTFLRTLGLRRIAEQELASLDAKTRAVIQSYVDGVNAYLADHQVLLSAWSTTCYA
jgi:penicillin amidase